MRSGSEEQAQGTAGLKSRIPSVFSGKLRTAAIQLGLSGVVVHTSSFLTFLFGWVSLLADLACSELGEMKWDS